MTTLSRRVRWLAPPVTTALALGVVGALASPASAAQTTFTQDTDIGIGGANYTPTNTTALEIPSLGPATPSFPSEIVSTNVGTITDVNVTLLGLNHTWSDDLDILLVGPGGQQ